MSDNPQERTEMVREHLYRFRRIPPKQQLFISKRLTPILAGLQGMAPPLPKGAPAEEVAKQEAARIQQFVASLSSIPDDDLAFIMDTTLAFTDRQLANGSWMPVYNDRAKALQFQELELDALFEIVLTALGGSLGPFLSSLQALFGAPTPE